MEKLKELADILAAKDWPRAEKLLRRAAKSQDPPAAVFYNLAKVLEAVGKSSQMRIWLKRAVAAESNYTIAWFELGRAELDANNPDAARTAFAKAADLDPRDKDARLNLARLELRWGAWQAVLAALGGIESDEADLLRYRARAELGEDCEQECMELLSRPSLRPAVLKAITRTAKGSIPLNPGPFVR